MAALRSAWHVAADTGVFEETLANGDSATLSTVEVIIAEMEEVKGAIEVLI